jgi:hypothetical protein
LRSLSTLVVAYDRWLMAGGLPQKKYGTHYRFANGRWVLHEVDPALLPHWSRPR